MLQYIYIKNFNKFNILELTSEQNEEENTEMDSKVKKLRYKRIARHYLADEVRKQAKDAVLTASTYHKDTHILVVGFNNGSFYLYEMPEVNMIHSLKYVLKMQTDNIVFFILNLNPTIKFLYFIFFILTVFLHKVFLL